MKEPGVFRIIRKKGASGMKILLGGVPFGCDNIGDEAILASVIGLVRGIARMRSSS